MSVDRPVVYVAHPLSGDIERNVASAKLWVRAAIDAGYAPLAPYLTLIDGILIEPDDRDIGLEIDFAVVARCDELWLCGDRISAGMSLERDAARQAGVRVVRLFSRADIPPLDEPLEEESE